MAFPRPTTLAQIAGALGLTQINATTAGAIAAVAGDIVNTSAAATVTLPANPTIGQAVLVNRGNHTALITINAGAGQTINGSATTCSMAAAGGSAYRGQALFIAQSPTEWNAIALGTDLALGVIFTGPATLFGAFTAASSATFNGGTNTAASAAVTAPVLAAAAQLAQTTKDEMLYITVTAAGTLTIAIGPANTVVNVIVAGLAAAIGDMYSIRLPAGWFVAVTTTTTATWTTTAIVC